MFPLISGISVVAAATADEEDMAAVAETGIMILRIVDAVDVPAVLTSIKTSVETEIFFFLFVEALFVCRSIFSSCDICELPSVLDCFALFHL